MRILHTADWHLGKKLQEYSRLEEQGHVLDEIATIADAQKADVVLIAGDIFDTFNPNHEAVELFYKTVRRLSANGTRPVLIISGNHDSTQFIEAPDPLAREMSILLYGNYTHRIKAGHLDNGIKIEESDTGFIAITLPGFTYSLRCILAPYANEMLLRTHLGEVDRELVFMRLLQKRWADTAAQYMDDKSVNLFLGHFFFMKEGTSPEAEPESERSILHVGGTQALYTQIIPKPIQYAALGHLHRYHHVGGADCPVVYAGSPLAYSFSEAGQQKFVIIVDVEPGKQAEVTPIPLTKGRSLHRLKFDNLRDTIQWLEANPYSFVELTYVTDVAIDATTRKAIYKAHDGIVHLIPELTGVNTTTQTSLSSDDLGKDIPSLFAQYYEQNRGKAPSAELMLIFNEILSTEDD
jgi:exonuclease SbcD